MRQVVTLKVNGFENQITMTLAAVSNISGTMRLYLSPDGRCHSLVRAETTKYEDVPVVTLKDFFAKQRITKVDLVKMDIEGAEYDIMYHIEDDILRKIDRISMEYHNLDDKKNNGKALQAFLQQKGLVVDRFESVNHDVGMIYASQK